MKKVNLGKINYDLLRDYSLTFLSFIIVGLSGLIIYYLIPKFLSSDASEIFAVFKKSSSLFLVALILGMGVAVPKFIIETDRIKASSILIKALFFSLPLTIIFLFFFLAFPVFFGELIIGREFLLIDTICISLIVISGIISSLIYSFFRGIYIVNIANLMIVLNSIIQIIVILIAKTIFQYIIIVSIVTALSSIFFLIFKSSFIAEVKTYTKKDFFNSKRLLSYGFLRVPGDFSLEGLSSLPVILTTTMYGVSYGGQMAFALTVFGLVLSLMSPVNFIMLPKIAAALKVEKDFEKAKSIVFQSALIVLPIVLISVSVIFIFSDFIAVKIFDSSMPYILSSYIKYICLAALPYAIYSLLRSVLDAWYKLPINSLNCVISLIILIVFKIIFKQYEFGIMYSMIFAYLYLGISTFVFYKRIFNIKNVQ